jgi:hypothetical protein
MARWRQVLHWLSGWREPRPGLTVTGSIVLEPGHYDLPTWATVRSASLRTIW